MIYIAEGEHLCYIMLMLEKTKKHIDLELRELLSEAKKAYEISSPKGLLFSGIKDFLLRNGKRIRPLLFIIGYQGYTKRKKYSKKDLVRSSLSMELLHDFLLIHDDVIDNSDLRRGKPTLHNYFNDKLSLKKHDQIGPSLSIVAGDIVYALAIKAFGAINESSARKDRALDEFLKATIATGTGEYLDVVNNLTSLDNIKKKDVFQVYTLKTARYTFEGPLIIGAILGGAPEKEISKLAHFAVSLGQAFQIQDDLLDIFASREIIGKPTLSDLDEGKKTLPLWKAYTSLPLKKKKTLKRIMDKQTKTRKELLLVKQLIKDSGSAEYSFNVAQRLLSYASKNLESLKIKPAYKKHLKAFTENFFKKMELLSTIIGSPPPRG